MRLKLIGSILFLIVLIVLGISKAKPYLVNSILKKFPENHEKALSEKILSSLKNDLKSCKAISDLHDIQILILKSTDELSFALPDNKIIISRGLIKASKQEEVEDILQQRIMGISKKEFLKNILGSFPLLALIEINSGKYDNLLKTDVSKLLDSQTSASLESDAEKNSLKLDDKSWQDIQNFCKRPKKKFRKKVIRTKRNGPTRAVIKQDPRTPLEKARDEGKFQYPMR